MSYQNNGSGAAVLEENVMNNLVMMHDPDGRVSQEWLNGIYNMSRPGKTTYSQFSSNGMSAWANYESWLFGEASRLYSWIDRGGSDYITWWKGGALGNANTVQEMVVPVTAPFIFAYGLADYAFDIGGTVGDKFGEI
ncbi:hypothetical protein, partial [Chryseobacterium indologenes]